MLSVPFNRGTLTDLLLYAVLASLGLVEVAVGTIGVIVFTGLAALLRPAAAQERVKASEEADKLAATLTEIAPKAPAGSANPAEPAKSPDKPDADKLQDEKES